MTPNRKRGRNNAEDEVEFMPLSKRINNLHINTNILLENHSENLTAWSQGLSCYVPQEAAMHPQPNPPLYQSPQYSPDLSEQQNPHYFNINKLLFQLYVERLQRCHVNL